MPLYEYKCNTCGDVFEVIQKFSDEPLTAHAACGGPVERLLSAPALQFKGTGWYVTDYAKSNGKNESGKGKADREARSDSGKKTETSAPPSSPSSSSTASATKPDGK